MDVLNHIRSIVFATNRDDIRSTQALLTRITGDHIAATMLQRLLYWMPKSRTGWIFKSWRDWEAECGLTRAQIKRIHNKGLLEAVGIERKTMKAFGTPTMHYRIDLDALLEKVASCLGISFEDVQVIAEWEDDNRPNHEANGDQSTDNKSTNSEGENNQNDWVENDQSITNTTPQKTTTNTINNNKQQSVAVDVLDSLEDLGFSNVDARRLVKQYGGDRVRLVIARASSDNVQNPSGFVWKALTQGWVLPEPKTILVDDPMRYIGGKYADFINH